MTGEKSAQVSFFFIRNPMCATLGFNIGVIIDISMATTE